MNPNHYPPSPAYYRHSNADARDLVTPSYWTDSALVHLMRAGRKDGEPFADAVRNAFVCLALWFRSQSLPVPFYSAELDRLQSRIAELEAAALTAAARPVAPALDTPAAEWTDAELMAWMDQAIAEPTESPLDMGVALVTMRTWHDGRVTVQSWMNSRRQYKIHLHNLHSRQVDCPTLAARILNAVKPGAAP